MRFENQQAKLRVIEALELRAKQFRSRDGTWPFRVPHEPLDLDEIIDAAVAEGERGVDPASLCSRSVLTMVWEPATPLGNGHTWDLWVIALPSAVHLYCVSDGDETRVLASAKQGIPGRDDRPY